MGDLIRFPLERRLKGDVSADVQRFRARVKENCERWEEMEEGIEKDALAIRIDVDINSELYTGEI